MSEELLYAHVSGHSVPCRIATHSKYIQGLQPSYTGLHSPIVPGQEARYKRYLAHMKHPPPGALQWDYVKGPTLYGGPTGVAVSYERGMPVQGYLAHKKQPPSLGPPKDPRYSPTVGFYGGGGSYERDTPVMAFSGREAKSWAQELRTDVTWLRA